MQQGEEDNVIDTVGNGQRGDGERVGVWGGGKTIL